MKTLISHFKKSHLLSRLKTVQQVKVDHTLCARSKRYNPEEIIEELTVIYLDTNLHMLSPCPPGIYNVVGI